MKKTKTSNMVKLVTTAFSLVLSLAAAVPAAAQKGKKASGQASVKSLRFLDAIEVSGPGDAPEPTQAVYTGSVLASSPDSVSTTASATETAVIEAASATQLKFSILLNTEVEQVQNLALFSLIDEWYGTRYELGGSTKEGIDCSAFVQMIYSQLFQILMPRTAREQYSACRKISRTEVKQGDLLFFNTRGGVSHVGIYLQNNKFVHAASSGGVMISDVYEDYWVKHFVGAGRYEKETEGVTLNLHP
jgi:lipoprotein Spr